MRDESAAAQGGASPNLHARSHASLLATFLLSILILAGCTSPSPASHSGGSGGASGGAAATAPASASGSAAAAIDLQQTVESVIQAAQPSVVEVFSSGAQAQAIGSGEILTADGNIVTNAHVVQDFNQFQVRLSNGNILTAQLKGASPADDLAVLKISQSGLRPITIGDSNAVRVGEFVLAIGSPLGLQQSATFGIVSALNRTASEAPSGPAGTLAGLIQTSAPINPGNSGGALVDLQGRLVGIPTLGATDPNSGAGAVGIGFAIPSNRVTFITAASGTWRTAAASIATPREDAHTMLTVRQVLALALFARDT